jgi:hypothetical protein
MMIDAQRCPRCGRFLGLVEHRCSLQDGQVGVTYQYRDPVKRRAYMRVYMRRRRLSEHVQRLRLLINASPE